MKFVHITEHTNIPKIRRRGIRLSRSGLGGQGVYAMPLMMLGRESPRHGWQVYWEGWEIEPDDILPNSEFDMIQSDPYSTLTMWKWLGKFRKRRSRSTAIVFTPPQSCLPISVAMLAPVSVARESHQQAGGEVEVPDRVFDDGIDFSKMCCKANSPRGFSVLLHCYLKSRQRPQDQHDDIKLVFRVSIPSSAIDQIIPFYRTDKEFNRYKRRTHQQSF